MNNLLLSGGQQSVVALSLIFAIQQCDPMPFYVFDEIDASLDPTYRMQVAKFIKDMSHHPTTPCQFICTTFREEIVKVADAWFLVEFRNDMSVVTSSDKSQSLKVGIFRDVVKFFSPSTLFCSLFSMRKSTMIVQGVLPPNHLLPLVANESVPQLSQKTKKILMVMIRNYGASSSASSK